MAYKKLRSCSVCHATYRYCPHCAEDKDKPTFYFTFCSENCRDIYDVTSKYANGYITAESAKAIIDTLNLSKFADFGNSYKATIAKINMEVAENNTTVEEVESVVDTTEEVVETGEIPEESVIVNSDESVETVAESVSQDNNVDSDNATETEATVSTTKKTTRSKKTKSVDVE